MKLCDVLMKMSEQDFITLVVDVYGVDFETDIPVGSIPEEMAAKEIIHISVRDNQLRMVIGLNLSAKIQEDEKDVI